MRLLFLILAHDRPDDAAALAATLTAAASDGRAIIHFDEGSSPAAFAALEAATVGAPRVALVRRRVRCAWGDWSLVQAVLNGLAEARETGADYDYVVLLSGACLPCRPIRQLERFLSENAGREFIEVEDESWMIGGLRAERHQLYFPLPPLRYKVLESALVGIQRALGVRRRMPDKLIPRFGSQWWTLTWSTCVAMLDYLAARPQVTRFFRYTWIPDEMAFPTLVHRLAPPDALAGFTLTHYQFTNYGKPIVFYDDHAGYVPSLQRFFVRKVSPEAQSLRMACLARAAAPDDGAPLDRIGDRNRDYEAKARAQTHFPVPGQIFFGDQRAPATDSVLRRQKKPYVVVYGPPALIRRVAAGLDGPDFEAFGRIFAPDQVDLGPRRARFAGLSAEDAPIRDLHPALYLTRVLRRAARMPVILWSPFDRPDAFPAVIWDPAAVLVACLPHAADSAVADRLLLDAACEEPPSDPVPGVSAEIVRAVQVEAAVAAARGLSRIEAAPQGRPILMPWVARDAPRTRAARAGALRRSLARSDHAAAPWFPALAERLQAIWIESFAGDVDLGAPPPRLRAISGGAPR